MSRQPGLRPVLSVRGVAGLHDKHPSVLIWLVAALVVAGPLTIVFAVERRVWHRITTNPLNSLLLREVRRGNANGVLDLLKQGADANSVDSNGEHAISLAAESPIQSVINAMSTSGYCHAIEKHLGYDEVVTALLKNGASPDVHNGDGITPLEQAERFDESDVVHLLRKAGARD